MRFDVVVVGAGPAGLAAAARLAEAGRSVALVAAGNGATHWGAGAVDVLGSAGGRPVEHPRATLSALPGAHPYRLTGVAALVAGLDRFAAFAAAAGLDHAGAADRNQDQVTVLGTLRRTCLVPAPAAWPAGGRVVVLGLAGFGDVPAELCAAGLRRLGYAAATRRVPVAELAGRRRPGTLDLARALDDPAVRRRLAREVGRAARGSDVAVLPAVLGLAGGHEPWRDLQARAGVRLVEAVTPPPCVPGLRLFAAWRARLAALGVAWRFGFPVLGVSRAADRVTAVVVAGAARPVRLDCAEVVLATGGVTGGGIVAGPDGSLTETVAGLPVPGYPDRLAASAPDFLGAQPLASAGIIVDGALRPVGPDGAPVLANVRCTGGLLAGHDPVGDASREGVALACAERLAAERTADR